MGFERICLLGVGLMGGSVGLASQLAASHFKITGYTPNSDELQQALLRRAIHLAATDAAAAVSGADLVILAAPVGAFPQLLKAITPALKPGAVVTDVGSTKRKVAELAGDMLPPHVRFVGSHPMAGGEKHGIEHARADLLTGALCILTPNEATDRPALEAVERFWQMLRMRTVRMTPEAHDRLTADISHLPHAIAAAMVRIQSPQSLQLAARGFLDTTRIAAGDADLWTDILLENRDNLRAGVKRLQADLQLLLEHLDEQDYSGVQEWLADAARTRLALSKPVD